MLVVVREGYGATLWFILLLRIWPRLQPFALPLGLYCAPSLFLDSPTAPMSNQDLSGLYQEVVGGHVEPGPRGLSTEVVGERGASLNTRVYGHGGANCQARNPAPKASQSTLQQTKYMEPDSG